MENGLRLIFAGLLLTSLLLAGCATVPPASPAKNRDNAAPPAGPGIVQPLAVPAPPPLENDSTGETPAAPPAAPNLTAKNPTIGRSSIGWSDKKALYIIQLKAGEELRFEGGRLKLLNFTRAGRPGATLELADARGNPQGRLELAVNQSVQFRGLDNVDYLAVAVFDFAEGVRAAVQVQLYRVKDLALSPTRISVGDPQNAYVLSMDYPLPVLRDNQTLMVGQSLNGSAFATVLAGLDLAAVPPKAIYSLQDEQGQTMAQFDLRPGQMVSFRAPDSHRYSVVFRRMENGSAITEAYQLQAFAK